jgi:hypothetical protein
MSSHKKTKKILFTSHVASFQKFNRPFMRMMSEKGWEVHYASMGEEEILDCDKSFVVPFTRSPFRLSNITAYRQLKKIINQENYDIIHTHTPMGSVVTRLAAKKARKNGTKIIYTAHGFHFFKGAPLLNWLIYYPVERLMARHTDTLITINKEDYHRAKKQFKTNVIYMPGVGVNPKRFKPKLTAKQKLELRKSLGLKKDDFVMIYPAELNKNKNQTLLLHVLHEINKEDKSVHLLLAGKDNLNGYHKKLADDLGVAKNVHFLGYRSDIPQLLQMSDLSVSASHREGLPVHLIEAMFAGLPIVTTKCRGATELVEDGVNGFVVGFDKVEFVERVQKIIENTQLRKSLGKKFSAATRNYEVVYAQRQTQKVYNKFIHEPLRILHVVTIMNRAGLETMLMNYYRAIDRSKIQFDFLVHRDDKGDYDDEIKSLGGRIYRLPSISFAHSVNYSKKAYDFFINHPEYSIVHSHLDSLSALPLAAAKKANVSTRIAHSHTSNFDSDLKKPIRNMTKHLIPMYATDFFGCSDEAMEFMFGKRAAKDGIVINNAIDTSKFTFSEKTRKKIRKEFSLPADSFVVGHVGRFNYPKNHEFLISIFNELLKEEPSAKLLLVGDGENKAIIKKQVSDLGISKSVIMTGVRNDIHDIMQAMDVFVMPSRYEGLPVVSIEAQASGLPCVFSDVVTTDLNITGNCRFISLKLNTKGWVEAILSFKKYTRRNTSEDLRLSGYDSHSEAVKIKDYYINQIGRECIDV